MVVFYSVGGLIIAVLTVVAGYYLWLLHRQNQRIKQFEQEQQQLVEAKRLQVNKSIQRLAEGACDSQLSLTEAAIRISVLLDSLSVAEEVRQEFTAFYLLAEKTAHIPILDEWKKLSTKEKLKFDEQRQALEKEFGDFVVDAAKRIVGKTF